MTDVKDPTHADAGEAPRGERSDDHGRAGDGDDYKVERGQEVTSSFDRAVEEGAERLNRTWPNLLATGFMAGIDVGFGVLALLFVEHETGSVLLGGLAFSIGFLALALGRSELFTENFLVPVATVIARKARIRQLWQLWVGTYVTNLAGGWLVAALVVVAYPAIHPTITMRADEIMERALSLESFALAVAAGAAITLMTWMERNALSEGGRLVAIMSFGFLLAATHMNHVVVISIKMFAGLQVGSDFGYADWLALSSFAVVGNMLGGLGLVTILRLVQVGGSHIERARRRQMLMVDEDGTWQVTDATPDDGESGGRRGAASGEREG